MRMTRLAIWAIGGALVAAPALLAAQVALPGVPALPRPGEVIGGLTGTLDDVTALRPADAARRLVDARALRLRDLLRGHRDSIELDDRREPAVRGVLLVTGASDDDLANAGKAGFATIERETIEGLDLRFAKLAAPEGLDLAGALRRLRKLLPEAEVSADTLHFPSGGAMPIAAASALAGGSAATAPLGLIDGGAAAHPAITSIAGQRGFARGAPAPSAHGTAVASLIVGQGPVRGSAPGRGLLVADVYGRDPAGGNASAIVRALGWMLSQNVPVVTISLVGPSNPLLARAVSICNARGLVIVAAVGNDGPAAPAAYPASYPGVVAVTAVDARGRALIEAGRAAHLDFAAPGADMRAAAIGGGLVKVRGTSYAAPLVAGRLGAHYPARNPSARAAALGRLNAEARRATAKGLGRGIVCGDCRS